MGEFNVSLPEQFHYLKDTPEGKEEELEHYLHQLDTALEEVLSRLFGRVVESVDSPTTGNLSKVDADGQLVDSGVAYNNLALLTGTQTIAGVKTFSSFPVTPSSAPSRSEMSSEGMILLFGSSSSKISASNSRETSDPRYATDRGE